MGTWINRKEKPFDDVRVRRALVLALDHWGSTAGLSKVSLMHTVGGLIFPGSPLAESKEQSEQIPGFWPEIDKSRAEARRLLKESGAEGLSFEPVNRNVDQPYKYLGTWLIDQWSKIGLHVTQRAVPAGPWFASLRGGDFAVSTGGVLPRHRQPGHGCASLAAALGQHAELRLLRTRRRTRHLQQVAARDRSRGAAGSGMPVRQGCAGEQAHFISAFWRNRLVPLRSCWKIGPSRYANQDLSTIWLAPPHCGECTEKPKP
ncbi:MAG: hypothetical protein J2P48_15210, partial [Alphaproteobacteria bacterium]|nr:hypothetical protein [Alphaproteobacteria bacterium]